MLKVEYNDPHKYASESHGLPFTQPVINVTWVFGLGSMDVPVWDLRIGL